MRSTSSFLGLLVALCSIAAAHAGFPTAYKAYERGDYATAFDEFTDAARRGHAAAQVSLGWMYAQGLGVDRDQQQASYWYRQAADRGNRDAQAILYIRRLGNGAKGHESAVDRVPERRDKLTEVSVDSRTRQGTADVTRSLDESRSGTYWYRKFAEAGRREAQFVLGVRYELGYGLPKDAFRATYWYRKAAEQGSALAQFNLGLKYAIGDGVALDQVLALYWYREAAAQGHLRSQFLVGVAYARGEGVASEPAQAVRWWREAAEGGYAPAQYHLGLMYAQGEGVARDWPQAYLWLSLAAAQGHDDARRSRDEVGTHIGFAEMARVKQLARR
jgi:TPR repeat protein